MKRQASQISVFILQYIVASLLLVWPSISSATTDAHSGYCDDIKSTAEALKCITEHKETAEKKLETVFSDLQKNLTEKQLEGFEQAHTKWLAYRDAECLWEANIVDASLTRLHELSCLTKLTEQQTARLQLKIDQQEMPEQVAEFGALPTWLNALNTLHSDVIWDIKSQKEYDLNCDEIKEIVVQGILIKDDVVEDTEIHSYFAVVHGSDTGKQKQDVILLDGECGVNPDITYQAGQDKSTKTCLPRIEIEGCGSVIAFWAEDNQYQMITDEIVKGQSDK